MRKTLAATFLAVVICVGVFGVSQAFAWELFLNHHHLNSGESAYAAGGNRVTFGVFGGSEGHAAVCTGLTGWGNTCGGENQYVEIRTFGFVGTPYVHDHSTYETYVFGYWE